MADDIPQRATSMPAAQIISPPEPAVDFKKILSLALSKEGVATLAAFFSIIVVSTGAAYSIGKDYGEKELQVYKAANDIDFKSLAKSATEASASLRSASAQIAALVEAGKTVQGLKDQISALQDETKRSSIELASERDKLNGLVIEYKSLASKYAALTGAESTFQIVQGKTALAANGNLLIGVVSAFGSYVELNLNSQSKKSSVEDIIPISIAGPPKTDCLVSVLETSLHDARVSSRCRSEPLPTCTPPAPPRPLLPPHTGAFDTLGLPRF
ncbi:hypothetical protein [Bradyrhizobium ivorense]|uniref:hypothetical protein n=1 Tax=Bradyrhizobium ivorense TaxID=2511166 RepID=UPI0010B8F43A|nr:hypothetical protein [Bradyrhizobium ivorense]VIO67032.1 hypothetical protein CI41S_03920 [Bradyrhizobium ivorense]